MPDDGKVGLRAEVVSDGRRLVQVQDDVPVSAGHKYRLARMLNQFDLEQINLRVGDVLRSVLYAPIHSSKELQCLGQS